MLMIGLLLCAFYLLVDNAASFFRLFTGLRPVKEVEAVYQSVVLQALLVKTAGAQRAS